MKPYFLFILVLCCLSSVAQSKLAQHQKKLKGIFKLTDSSTINTYYIQLKLNNVSKPEPYTTTTTNDTPGIKRNLHNLSDRGQEAFINNWGRLADTDKDFLDNLSKNMDSPSPSNPIEFKSTDFISKFDFKIDNQTVNKANRIDQLEIWVTLDNTDEVEFSGFSNFASKYKTVDFGTLSVNRVTGFTANAGVNFGGTGSTTSTISNSNQGTINTGSDEFNTESNQNTGAVSNVNGTGSSNQSNLGIGYSNSKTVGQQVAIKSEIVSMKGSLSRKEFSIIQNGAPNQDLSDNVSVNVIGKAKQYSIERYFIVKGLFNSDNNDVITDVNKITVKAGYITCPKIINDVKATVSYAFIYRKVIKGENSIQESDDVIEDYYTDDRTLTGVNQVVFKANELKTKLFIPAKHDNTNNLYMDYFGKKYPLYFSDEVSALQFIEWLTQTRSVKLKNFDLYVSDDGTSFRAYTAILSNDFEALKKSI